MMERDYWLLNERLETVIRERDEALLQVEAAKDRVDRILQDFSFLEIEAKEFETERDNALLRIEELERDAEAMYRDLGEHGYVL